MDLSNQQKCTNFWKFIFDVLESEGIDIDTFFLKAAPIIPHHIEESERLLRNAKKRSTEFEHNNIGFKEFSETGDDFVFSIMQANDLMKGL